MLKKLRERVKRIPNPLKNPGRIPWSARLAGLASLTTWASGFFPDFSTGEFLTFFAGFLLLIAAIFKAISEAGITIKIETNGTKSNDS